MEQEKKSRLKTFAIELITLVTKGQSEKLQVISDKLDDKTLISYLNEKYKDQMAFPLNEEMFSLAQYDEVLQLNSLKAKRDFGITEKDDGLLFAVAVLIAEIVD